MCPPPDHLNRREKFRYYWKNLVYRNFFVYCTVLLTFNTILNLIALFK